MSSHPHLFLGTGHARNERRAWAVIGLCTAMMLLEIGGGVAYGSLALVADGLHMSTHAIALLVAALAYGFARRHAADPRFCFGTGKFGDLAGFASALVLAMIALLIGYEAVMRFLAPVPIEFREAIPIAVLGLLVNVVSAWLLGGGEEHGHAHGHAHAHPHDPEHEHDEHDRDHNLRAAFVHVAADAAVSVLAILGLLAVRYLGWAWMDPAMGIVGALVIAAWAYALVRDTGRILLDMTPDAGLAARIRALLEADGDRLTDLHLWRLGPGHLGAILAVATPRARGPAFYRARLAGLDHLSHVTIEVSPVAEDA